MSPVFTAVEEVSLIPLPPAPVGCPLCGGPLLELRGLCRCVRCQYVICQGCESERPVEGGPPEW